MSSNLPIGCENDLSAPFNEVEYTIRYIDNYLKIKTYRFYSRPNLTEYDILEYAKDLIEFDLDEIININDIMII